MEILEILQTIGICISALMLMGIAYMLFIFLTPLLPPSEKELQEMEQQPLTIEILSPKGKNRRNRSKGKEDNKP